ncbi:MAG: Lrp/AsnC family transcriptional regulator [SAR202 cluster bacterium]|jgi:DNA-binding Lrp family transcriptional regulator|nr:AsnC family transcriptional regulator [Dehalococcoidia bacterium]MQG53505.1 Lrp/AsnC family transcriptional regulator [SAR202 cluster bacterium]|tara:strand:+ start:38220 stop:39302 length:1083 start_codon:yes stop_codon:yes gene_type:complete
MDITDRKLLNLIQGPFPMVDQPFQKLGEEVGISEQEVLERLAELKRTNVLRQISAIFDTRRLGFKTTLVAMAYETAKLHDAAMVINKHPGVSHNYAREGSYYNLWFTLAVPPEHDLEATADYMARKTNALEQRIMPTKRFFKIGVNFDMVKKKGSSFNFSPDNVNKEQSDGETAANKEEADSWNKAVPVTEAEKDAIRGMQEDLELIPRPYDQTAEQLGMTTDELFALAKDFQDRRIMRRYSAVLHHRRSGFRANAMIVWKVPEERSEEVGLMMASHDAVTHCYERPTFPDWPYTHFTMVHATTPEGCEEINTEISEATGITERLVLYSTREYKKTRVRYFVPDYDEYVDTEKPDAIITA